MSYYFQVTKADPGKLANKREKERLWQAANRERVNKKQRDRSRQNKLAAIDYLGGVCVNCGGTFHSSVYDFHHRDPSEKDFEISKIKWKSFENFKDELDKCDLLCSNCHRELHYKLSEHE